MAERERSAVEMRLAGASFDAIGAKLGINKSGAYKAYWRGINARGVRHEDRERARALELERLDAMQLSAWRDLRPSTRVDKDGNPIDGWQRRHSAIERLLKISDRRCRLLGLDAPQRIELAGAMLVVDYARASTEQLERIAAARSDHAQLAATLAAVAAEQAALAHAMGAEVAGELPEAVVVPEDEEGEQ